MTSFMNYQIPTHTHSISPLSMGERDGYFTPMNPNGYTVNPNHGINVNAYPGIPSVSPMNMSGSHPSGSPLNMTPITPVMSEVPPMNHASHSMQIQAQPQSIQLQGQAQSVQPPQHSNQLYYYPPYNQYVYYHPSAYPTIESPKLGNPYFPPVPMRKKSKLSTTWSPKEDKLLRELKEIQKLGWREISTFFMDRTPNACQFRWRRIISGTSTAGVKRRSHHDIKFLLN